jgi:hypothetical protein
MRIDGRWFTVIFLLILPAAMIAVSMLWFGSNPIAIFSAFAAMIAGAFYLLTYTDSFA